jgi:hypothetical protein
MVDLSPLKPWVLDILRRKSCLSAVTAKAVQGSLLEDQRYDRLISPGADLLGRDKAQFEDYMVIALPCKCLSVREADVSHSAVVSHLESGTCPSRINRKMIDDYVVRHDTRNFITNPQRMITDGSGRTFANAVPTYEATEQAWNGSAYGCYFCPLEFPYLGQLNQHLNSPAHARRDNRLYRCPKMVAVSRQRRCRV